LKTHRQTGVCVSLGPLETSTDDHFLARNLTRSARRPWTRGSNVCGPAWAQRRRELQCWRGLIERLPRGATPAVTMSARRVVGHMVASLLTDRLDHDITCSLGHVSFYLNCPLRSVIATSSWAEAAVPEEQTRRCYVGPPTSRSYSTGGSSRYSGWNRGAGGQTSASVRARARPREAK